MSDDEIKALRARAEKAEASLREARLRLAEVWSGCADDSCGGCVLCVHRARKRAEKAIKALQDRAEKVEAERDEMRAALHAFLDFTAGLDNPPRRAEVLAWSALSMAGDK